MNTQAQDLFTRALELPEAYLAKACGEDAELRLEVQQLLVDAERADSFFGEPGGDATLAADGSGQTSGKKASSPTGAPPSLPAAASDLIRLISAMVNWFAMAHDLRGNHQFAMGLLESQVDGFEGLWVIARGWF